MLQILAFIMMLILGAVGMYLFYCMATSSSYLDASLSELNPLNLWRFIVCGSISSVVALLIVHFSFPDTAWLDQVRLGVGMGALPGLLTGWIWQLKAGQTICLYLRKWVHVAIIFSAVFFLYNFGSNMFGELNQKQLRIEKMRLIHSLAERDISQVNISFENSQSINITNAGEIESFKESLADAKLVKQDDRDVSEKIRIEIHSYDDILTYDGFLASVYPNDILLIFSSKQTECVIRLHDLNRWLNEEILSQQ